MSLKWGWRFAIVVGAFLVVAAYIALSSYTSQDLKPRIIQAIKKYNRS